MNRADMEHFGTALSKKGSQRIDVVDVAEVPVALLNYTYGTNGIPLPSDMPWSVPLIDPERIVADAARAKREGAEVVLVSLHFGTEYSTAPDSYQTSVVDRITRSPDIDLVYGHHAHVPQPFDKVNGTWVAYGLGNFIAQQLTSMPDTYRGITARFSFRETPAGEFRVTDAAYLPTLITPYVSGDPRMRVLDAAAALRDPTTPEGLRPSLQTTVAEVRAAAELLNADKHGLHLWRSWRG
jgi:poly-gamma-glutamate synthesis protein (capsule biosynthesis protein)